MSSAFLAAFGSVFAVSLVSLIGIFWLTVNDRLLKKLIFALVSLSVGVLFGDVFIHILPELYEGARRPETISLAVLLGIALFFVLEKLMHVDRAHEGGRDAHSTEEHRALGPMILAADSLHNFLDGAIIGASYMVSMEVGVATTVAVLLHEIPHEVGNFGILLHAGYSKGKAILYNCLTALAAFGGLIAAAALGFGEQGASDILLAVAAGGFVYIAGSDLVPELQKETRLKSSLVQFSAILFGFALMLLFAVINL